MHPNYINEITLSSLINFQMNLNNNLGQSALYYQYSTALSLLFLILIFFNRSNRTSGISHGLSQHKYFWNVYGDHYCDSSYINTTLSHPANIHNL